MLKEFNENEKILLINEVKKVINKIKLNSEMNGVSAQKILETVNLFVNCLISSVGKRFKIDEEILTKLDELKQSFIDAAKKEIHDKMLEEERNEVPLCFEDLIKMSRKEPGIIENPGFIDTRIIEYKNILETQESIPEEDLFRYLEELNIAEMYWIDKEKIIDYFEVYPEIVPLYPSYSPRIIKKRKKQDDKK